MATVRKYARRVAAQLGVWSVGHSANQITAFDLIELLVRNVGLYGFSVGSLGSFDYGFQVLIIMLTPCRLQ